MATFQDHGIPAHRGSVGRPQDGGWEMRRPAQKRGDVMPKSLQRELQSTHKSGPLDKVSTWTPAMTKGI